MKGTYTLIVECETEGSCVFGKLGRASLRRGHYLYTGSALGPSTVSLEGRLERHEARSKRRWWHIDYLTSKRGCRVRGAVYLLSHRKLECKVSHSISEELNLLPVLPKIGASDCKCDGHLLGPEFRLGRVALLKRLVSIYGRVGLSRSFIMVRRLD